MEGILAALKRYAAELGADPEVLPDSGAPLPIFLSQAYGVFHGRLFDQPFRFAVGKRRQPPSPAELENHARLLAKHLGSRVVFVFQNLPSFDRARLLKRRVPFIVPQRQMFIPGHMVDLRETGSVNKAAEAAATLSAPAQLLLLHHLLKPADAPRALHEWAGELKYSRMSMTRAHRELTNAGLVKPAISGKSVEIAFVGDRQALWERALPIFQSPVQKREYYRRPHDPPTGLLEAGLTALAEYTDLAEGPSRVYAIWKPRLRHTNLEPVPYRDENSIAVEDWAYPPETLSPDGRIVDRLSLYLSLRDNADERIQQALQNLVKREFYGQRTHSVPRLDERL